MRDNIKQLLFQNADSDYRDFSSKLIPDSKPLIGVRLPILRKAAKQLVKEGKWHEEISSYEGEFEDRYFEEVMLRGMIIGYGAEKEETEYVLKLVADFIPYIDNWSVCDSFCSSFSFAAKNREVVWEFIQKYLYSDKEFEVRTSLIILLTQYLKSDSCGKRLVRKKVVAISDLENNERESNIQGNPYLERILNVLNRPYNQGYYAQMAAAWTTAEAFVTYPYETLQMLTVDCKMDSWTYNKTMQKICESNTPDKEVKNYIKNLKRKG